MSRHVAPSHRPLVVHLIPSLGPGGAEGALATNLGHFADKELQHVVVVIAASGSRYCPGEHFWAAQVMHSGIELIWLNARDRRTLPSVLASLVRVLRNKKASVVHAHLMLAGLLGSLAATATGLPLIRTLHSVSYEPEVLATYRRPGALKHDVARRLEALALRTATSRVVAVGENVARSAVRQFGIPRERISVVHNPVRVRPPSRHARAEIRAQLGMVPDAPLVVTVGRVVASKAHGDLVRAMCIVRRWVPRAHLAIVGDMAANPDTVRKLRCLVDATGATEHVSLVGARSNVGDWLAAADCFAFPSEFEGVSVALAEAALAGCSCVVSDIPGNREVIAGEDMGIICPVGNVEELSGAIARLLLDRDLSARYGAAARRFAAVRFDPVVAARRHESLYHQLARQS